MKLSHFKQAFVALLGATFVACSPKAKIDREADFNFDWQFTQLADTTTLTQLPLDDSQWREVRLPHDWSVEASFDESLEGCTGYLPGGVGVYQKHFATPYDATEKSTIVLFDGVYNNAKFWLNGTYLGENPYGYSPVQFNLTPYLTAMGEENTLTVYVDHSRYADSRWYTGSGIYRNVKLITVDKLHIPIWGTFVTTPQVSEQEAEVNIAITVANELSTPSSFTLATTIVDGEGDEVTTTQSELTLAADSTHEYDQTLTVESPQLWDTDHPNMYKAITAIYRDGKKVDEYTTPFGIRTLLFDKDKGFFLNGKSTYAKGVCLHHDGGLVGAAVPEGVWRRRLATLKAAGCNAIRTSHNPFSEEFLDLCDEMGFLVQNEIFDEMDNPKDKRFNMTEREVLYRTRGYTEHFQEWGESDLKRVILRDRNHPCVFQYSIGNEIEWTYPHYKEVSGLWDKGVGGYWNKIPQLTPEEMKARYDALPPRKYVLAETAKRLSGWVKELDTTRPVTANLIIPVASCVTGYADALDVVGFSYQIAQYDWCKKHFPHMMFTGNENTGLLQEWKSITDNPMVFSMYMWTGIDYLGECHDRWPQKAWNGDMLDLAGFEKAGYNHFKAIWCDEPMVAIQTHAFATSPFKIDAKSGKILPKKGKVANWDNILSQPIWNYNQGDSVVVEVVSNQPEVELSLNGKSLGSVKLSDCPDNIMRWVVPYSEGLLLAQSTTDGKTIQSQLTSASAPVALEVMVDQSTLAADGYDVAHLVVQLVDANGVAVKTEERNIQFEVEGDVKLLGVDNGWCKSTQDYQADHVESHLGRTLAIVQSIRDAKGKATITITADGIAPQQVTLVTK